MARKDDPVFNVKFVELVEKQACLWNYTHPGYSKKEEVQKAWQHVANEIKDTVRNSRERWRTIRSSFLRSLKLARTQTGRGKRKYYLSKYLQFLIPYTKSRACHNKQLPAAGQHSATAINPQMTANGGMVLRKPSTTTTSALAALPMIRIGQMRQQHHHHHLEEDTKDSNESAAQQPSPVQSDDEPPDEQQQQQQQQQLEEEETNSTPMRLQAIKVEQQQQQQHAQSNDKIVATATAAQHSLVTLPVTMAAALRNNLDWTELTEWLKCSSSSGGGVAHNQLQFHQQHNSSGNGNSNMLSPPPATGTPAPATATQTSASAATAAMTATVATAAAAAAATPPDADYSFLISLHPYLKEMSGKQNRRFRQKVVGLIDNVLDNVDI